MSALYKQFNLLTCKYVRSPIHPGTITVSSGGPTSLVSKLESKGGQYANAYGPIRAMSYMNGSVLGGCGCCGQVGGNGIVVTDHEINYYNSNGIHG